MHIICMHICHILLYCTLLYHIILLSLALSLSLYIYIYIYIYVHMFICTHA